MAAAETKEKILVIDDEDSVRDIVQMGLQGENFETIGAPDGRTGIALAESEHPDLILCDIRMSGLDGYATLQALRENKATETIPVIFMTGAMTDYAAVRQGMSTGADDYIVKPFTIADLVSAIRSRLRMQQIVLSHAEARLSSLRENIGLSLPHELRTPLVSILGFAKFLQQNYQTLDRADIGKMADGMFRAGTRLHELIEQFLIYTEVEMLGADAEAVKKLQTESTPGIHILLRVLARQSAAAASRPGDLILELSESCASISPEHLTTIMNALLDNAFKFSETGSPVTLHCAGDEQWQTIIVADKGRGMSSEQLASIGGYMQFGRKVYEQQGSGLGLIIAKRLTEIHGGTFDIQSAPSEGTTITLKIPNTARE